MIFLRLMEEILSFCVKPIGIYRIPLQNHHIFLKIQKICFEISFYTTYNREFILYTNNLYYISNARKILKFYDFHYLLFFFDEFPHTPFIFWDHFYAIPKMAPKI